MEVRASPYYSISLDEKDRFLIVVLSYFKEGRKTVPVAYRDLPGFEAIDIFTLVRSLLESWGLD